MRVMCVPEAPTVTMQEVLDPQGLLEETKLGGSALAWRLRGHADVAEAANVPLVPEFPFKTRSAQYRPHCPGFLLLGVVHRI